MTRNEANELLQSSDLAAIGGLADTRRRERHSGQIVTYCLETDDTQRITFRDGSILDQLDRLKDVASVAPVCSAAFTAAEYLKIVALCQLYLNTTRITVALDYSGLKIGQLALRFGANDMVQMRNEPKPGMGEEEIRRLIREAGFVPKRRDATGLLMFLD